ncbi:hypothetical protein BX666DRAFT_1875087 [Dichotomocladium elegans]|nr:hypothetical protein BX666DRAFT_1875087 [Dichotomocladium elegans]
MAGDLKGFEYLYSFAISLPGLDARQATMLLCIGLTAANDAMGVAAIATRHLETLGSIEEQAAWVEYARNAIAKAWVICSFPRAFFDRVYQKQSESIEAEIRGINPDLWMFVQDGYSYVSDTLWMTEVETELSVIVNLYTMGANPQLAPHLEGARNVGATQEQVESALEIAKVIEAMRK